MVILFATFLLIASTQKDDTVRTVTPSEIRADRYHFYNKKVRICGDTIGQNGEFVLLQSEDENSKSAVSVDPKLVIRKMGDVFCVTGTIKRSDGLTLEEAQFQGKSYVIVDTIFDPQYIVRN